MTNRTKITSISILILLILLYIGYWLSFAHIFKEKLEDTFKKIGATYTSVNVKGFPLKFTAEVKDFHFEFLNDSLNFKKLSSIKSNTNLLTIESNILANKYSFRTANLETEYVINNEVRNLLYKGDTEIIVGLKNFSAVNYIKSTPAFRDKNELLRSIKLVEYNVKNIEAIDKKNNKVQYTCGSSTISLRNDSDAKISRYAAKFFIEIKDYQPSKDYSGNDFMKVLPLPAEVAEAFKSNTAVKYGKNKGYIVIEKDNKDAELSFNNLKVDFVIDEYEGSNEYADSRGSLSIGGKLFSESGFKFYVTLQDKSKFTPKVAEYWAIAIRENASMLLAFKQIGVAANKKISEADKKLLLLYAKMKANPELFVPKLYEIKELTSNIKAEVSIFNKKPSFSSTIEFMTDEGKGAKITSSADLKDEKQKVVKIHAAIAKYNDTFNAIADFLANMYTAMELDIKEDRDTLNHFLVQIADHEPKDSNDNLALDISIEDDTKQVQVKIGKFTDVNKFLELVHTTFAKSQMYNLFSKPEPVQHEPTKRDASNAVK